MNPQRVTALHRRHLALGASMFEREGWQLPASYGDRAAELEAVRSHIALLDIGESGKIDLKGTHLGQLLTLAFVGTTPPEVGRSSWNPSDQTRILRLTADHALLIVEPDCFEPVLSRLGDVADGEACVHAVDVTGAYCGLRLLGPRAPALFERLSALDLSPARFPPGAVVEGAVARIHAIVVRCGPIGEAAGSEGSIAVMSSEEFGYDIYVDRDLGIYFWDVLSEVGAPLGLRPVGRSVERGPA